MTSVPVSTAVPVPAWRGNTDLPPAKVSQLWKAAQDFEATALGEMLRPMFDTVDASHGPFGGGEAEVAWRPMLVDAIGKQVAASGRLGLAAPVFAALVRAQEARQGGSK